MLRMTLQPRVMDDPDCGMTLEKFSERQGVFVVPLHAQRERSQATKHQPCVEWTQRRPQDNVSVPNRCDLLLTAHHSPGNEIGVSAEVLGGTVNRNVNAQVKGTLIEGGREGIVNHGCNAS